MLTPQTSVSFSRANMLAPDGRCKPFDAAADGYVRLWDTATGSPVGRPLLAAAQNPNPIIQRAIAESFVTGYHFVIWIATSLAALSAIAAWLLIESRASAVAKRV